MGYMTNYELTFNGDVSEETLADLLTNTTGYTWDDNLELHDAKWYNHHNDMIYVSTQYPYVEFTLKGEGEESGDLWKTYYLNGKYQEAKAKITYDEYDRSKLKSK